MSTTPVSLLERLRRQPDAAAWQRWFDLYHPILKRWLTRADLQAADVEEVTQDVLLTVLKEVPHFQHNGRPGAFRSWLRQIAVNRLRELIRAKHRAVAGAGWGDHLDRLLDPSGEPARRWDDEHDQLVLRRLLDLVQAEVSSVHWEAFRRVALNEEPVEQVAAVLGLSVNAVRVAKCRVLGRLREEGRDLIS